MVLMTGVRARHFQLFLLGSFFSFLFLLFQSTGWSLLDRWQIKGHLNFIDLNSVLGSADCYQSIGFEIYKYPIGHECAYNYGSWLMRSISFIGLGVEQTYFVGSVFIVLISFLMAFVMTQATLGGSGLFFGFLIFVSPPIMLLLERGNIDSLMFILIFIAALLFKSDRSNASLILVVVSLLFKFYTVGLAAMLAFMSRSMFTFFVWTSVIVLAIVQVFNDFRNGPGFINTEWTSFGAPVFGIYLKYLSVKTPYFLSLVIGFLLLIAAVWFISRPWTPFYKLYKALTITTLDIMPSYHLFLFFSVVHTTCYILGMNFDYRLIMLAIANFILLSQAKLHSSINLIIGISTVVIMWTSYNLQISQPLGDVLIGITTAYYICIFWQFFNKLQLIVRFNESRSKLFRKFLR